MTLSTRHRSAIPAERRYTVTEAACLADVCTETIYRALRAGELHGVKRCTIFTDRRPGPEQGRRWGRVWWEMTGADLIAWYEARRRAWLASREGDAVKWRSPWTTPGARDRAVLRLAREIIRQAGDLVEVELEGGASISGGDGSAATVGDASE